MFLKDITSFDEPGIIPKGPMIIFVPFLIDDEARISNNRIWALSFTRFILLIWVNWSYVWLIGAVNFDLLKSISVSILFSVLVDLL